MTPDHRLAQIIRFPPEHFMLLNAKPLIINEVGQGRSGGNRIIGTIHAIRTGALVSKGLVMLLLEPWPDLYRDAITREGEGWINLLQAAPARIVCTLK